MKDIDIECPHCGQGWDLSIEDGPKLLCVLPSPKGNPWYIEKYRCECGATFKRDAIKVPVTNMLDLIKCLTEGSS